MAKTFKELGQFNQRVRKIVQTFWGDVDDVVVHVVLPLIAQVGLDEPLPVGGDEEVGALAVAVGRGGGPGHEHEVAAHLELGRVAVHDRGVHLALKVVPGTNSK